DCCIRPLNALDMRLLTGFESVGQKRSLAEEMALSSTDVLLMELLEIGV
ncbi:hypothetical protein Rin_00014910, partial [Candidatus Regiella insecticola 5.15]